MLAKIWCYAHVSGFLFINRLQFPYHSLFCFFFSFLLWLNGWFMPITCSLTASKSVFAFLMHKDIDSVSGFN